MIVVRFPTVVDGVVFRWYLTLDDAVNGNPVLSVSRNGVMVLVFLHVIPAEVMQRAESAYRLLRGGAGDIQGLATHRRAESTGPRRYVPVAA